MATSIREILDSLPEDDRRLLDFCFNSDIANYIVLDNGYYVGVYCDRIPTLGLPELQSGVWCVGKLAKTEVL